ncbi:PAS domain S-box protein [Roseitalea porphyridii]|uniref:histidine kinase n=1 Tax=Roseitalea porphyridii TaxID=1852022 RepID=A0A4P6UWH8_9HYPH|nr:PAS domain S-box protein [Roseitalea porphyridii]QBK29547.1 PAS domain S-box protein [Roseitalea porphyridii]
MTKPRNWDETSFIDIAVQDGVREAMLSGRAALVFDRKCGALRWANGAAASLFGLAAIGSRAGADGLPTRVEIGFRQIRAVLASLKDAPRTALVRLPGGMTSRLVRCHVRRIDLPGVSGKHALVTAPTRDTEMSEADCMAMALTGLEDEEAGAAIVDGAGRVLGAGPRFGTLGLSEQSLRSLTGQTRSEADRLVKQIIDEPGAATAFAAGVGRLGDLPERYLVVAVPLAHRPAPDEPDATTGTVIAATPPDQTASIDETLDAVTIAEDADPQHFDQPAPRADEESAGGSGEATGEDDAEAPSAPEAPRTDADADRPDRTVERPAYEPFAGPDLSSGPIRFVWKTDAEGVFLDVSPEFARAVGPRAADLGGRTFADMVEALALDPRGDLAAAFARRDTWSGKTVYWPIEDTDLQVPVDLAALPYHDRDRKFGGYRGFGVVRIADATTDPDARGKAIAFQPAPVEPAAGIAAAEAETGEPADHAQEPPVLAVAPAHPLRRASDALVPPPGGDEDETGAPRHLSAQEAEAFRKIGQALGRQQSEPFSAPGDDAAGLTPAEDGMTTTDAGASTLFPPEGVPAEVRNRETGDDEHEAADADSDAFAAGSDVLAGEETDDTFAPFMETESGDEADLRDEPLDAGEDDGNATDEDAHPLSGTENTFDADEEADEPPALAEDAEALLPEAPQDDERMAIAAAAGVDGVATPGLGPDSLDALPLPLLIVRNEEALYANDAFTEMTGDAGTAELNERGLDSLFGGTAPAPDADEADRLVTLVGSDGEPLAARAHLQIVPWMGTRALMFAFEPRHDAPPAETAGSGELSDTPGTSLAEAHAVSSAEIAELRAILDTATDGVILIDADSTIRSLSASASALFGYANEEVEGKSFSYLFAHESQRAALDYLHGLSNNGVASVLNEGREVLGRERNGGFLPLFMTIGRMPATNGYCAVIRDITPWKQTEQALQDAKRQAEQASNTKSEFLAKISHEIRTPLNAIIGFSELMAEERFGPIGNERYKDYLADINKSGRHVLDLVNDLLDISKIEAGKQELEFESVALNDAIGEAIAMVQPQANRNQIIVRSSLESTVPPVVADLRSIKQIVLNLLSNAIRFTHAGGQVIVSTSYTGDGAVLLRIRDTGIGMSEKELESALKPFQQVTAVGRQRGDGTGLGLPLTKALVEANRAEFAISSEPGQGTRIDIVFPPARVLAS